MMHQYTSPFPSTALHVFTPVDDGPLQTFFSTHVPVQKLGSGFALGFMLGLGFGLGLGFQLGFGLGFEF